MDSKKARQSDKVEELDLEDFQSEQEPHQLRADHQRSTIKGKLNIIEAVPEKEVVKTIPVIKIIYWDGSKFIIRTDKAGYKRILCKLRVKMRSRFLALSIEEQTEITRKGNMLKQTEENMSEEDYLKIAPHEDLIRE